MEYKFTPLSQLKMTDSGPGTCEGYRARFGNLDDGGDILIKGAFADTLEEYMNSGFTAHSHDWTFAEAIGFPLEAREDQIGWWVKSQFHSTATAQTCRTICKERMKAGKQVGFSFGYQPLNWEIIAANDYERKLPIYLKAEYLDDGMMRARDFAQVRVLKKVRAIEDSLVTCPMNKLAAATAVKSRHATLRGFESWRLESSRVRNHALKTLYCSASDRGDSSAERRRLDRAVDMARLQLRVAESRLRAQRYQ